MVHISCKVARIWYPLRYRTFKEKKCCPNYFPTQWAVTGTESQSIFFAHVSDLDAPSDSVARTSLHFTLFSLSWFSSWNMVRPKHVYHLLAKDRAGEGRGGLTAHAAYARFIQSPKPLQLAEPSHPPLLWSKDACCQTGPSAAVAAPKMGSKVCRSSSWSVAAHRAKGYGGKQPVTKKNSRSCWQTTAKALAHIKFQLNSMDLCPHSARVHGM